MNLRWYTLVVDSADPRAIGHWWAEAIGWQIVYDEPHEVVLVPPHAMTKLDEIPVMERGPGLVFVQVPEKKAGKNRLHLDLRPDASGDYEAEALRLIDLGATRVDVGQADKPWIVLADPEGNEFCVLGGRDM